MVSAKRNKIFAGYFFMIISLLVYLLILFVTLRGTWISGIVELLASFFLLVTIFEAGHYLVRKNRLVNEELTKVDNTIYSSIATIDRIKQRIGLFITVLLFLTAIIIAFLTAENTFSINFYSVMSIGLLVTYAVFRKALFKVFESFGKWAKEYLRKHLPSYQVFSDRIVINPHITGLKTFWTVLYSEIQEIRIMSFEEATIYQENLGPDFSIQIGMTKDLWNLRNERPNTYFAVQSVGKTVLLKGPKIHMLISFSNPSHEDLIKNFEKYKHNFGAQ